MIDISRDNAVFAMQSQVKDIEDAFRYYSAIQHKLDYFISSDKGLLKMKEATLPVVSAREFLKLLA